MKVLPFARAKLNGFDRYDLDLCDYQSFSNQLRVPARDFRDFVYELVLDLPDPVLREVRRRARQEREFEDFRTRMLDRMAADAAYAG